MIRFLDAGGRSYGAVGASYATLLQYWTNQGSFNSAGAWSVAASGGRVSGSSLRFTYGAGSNVYAWLYKSLSAQATWGASLAFKINSFPSSNSYWSICSFYDSSTAQCGLRVLDGGFLSVVRGESSATTLGISTNALSANVWYHLEVKFVVHPSTGTAEVRLYGVPVIGPLTGLNTRVSANSSADTFQIGQRGGTPNNSSGVEQFDYDDIIVWDGQTTDPSGNTAVSDFIGDCGLAVLRPSAAGTTTQWTPDSGSNYARVQEATPDTTSYVESSTVTNKDTYAHDDLPATVTAVKGLATVHYARKTDVGSRQMGSVIRTNSLDFAHPTGIDLADSYLYYLRTWDRNPDTTAAWTKAEIDALEAGQKVNT